MAQSPNVAYAVPQTQIGLAIETTLGTPAAPTFWIPVKGPKYKPDLTLIPDDTLQGSMVSVYGLVRGMRYDAHGWDSYPYLDSFPVFLRAELGSSDNKTAAPSNTTLSQSAVAGVSTLSCVATIPAGSYITVGSGATLEAHVTGTPTGSGPFSIPITGPLVFPQASAAAVTGLTKHQFSLLNNAGSGNQPPSVTLTDYDGEEWRQLSASQLDQLTIKGNATGLVDYTCSWFSNPSITPSTPTPAYTTAQAVPGWSTIIAIGGTVVGYYIDWEVDLKRGVKPIPALNGTQEYFLYYAGPLEATGKLTVIEQSGAPELTKYLNGVQTSLDIYTFDLATGDMMNLHSTLAQFKTGEIDRGSEYVKVPLEFQCLPSSADALAGGVSPIIATVANARTTVY